MHHNNIPSTPRSIETRGKKGFKFAGVTSLTLAVTNQLSIDKVPQSAEEMVDPKANNTEFSRFLKRSLNILATKHYMNIDRINLAKHFVNTLDIDVKQTDKTVVPQIYDILHGSVPEFVAPTTRVSLASILGYPEDKQVSTVSTNATVATTMTTAAAMQSPVASPVMGPHAETELNISPISTDEMDPQEELEGLIEEIEVSKNECKSFIEDADVDFNEDNIEQLLNEVGNFTPVSDPEIQRKLDDFHELRKEYQFLVNKKKELEDYTEAPQEILDSKRAEYFPESNASDDSTYDETIVDPIEDSAGESPIKAKESSVASVNDVASEERKLLIKGRKNKRQERLNRAPLSDLTTSIENNTTSSSSEESPVHKKHKKTPSPDRTENLTSPDENCAPSSIIDSSFVTPVNKKVAASSSVFASGHTFYTPTKSTSSSATNVKKTPTKPQRLLSSATAYVP